MRKHWYGILILLGGEEVPVAIRLLGISVASIIIVSMMSALTYWSLSPASVELPYTITSSEPYVYESNFTAGELGVLNESYWVGSPELISGSFYIENGLLKIVSNNRYQIGFGANWTSPTYESDDWQPWLPVFWKYYADVTFAEPEGEIPTLIVENWIACEGGKSITAMVWYKHGSLFYSYGRFPNDLGYGVLLGQFGLPSEFNVTINADYRARSMNVDWDNHKYSVPLQIERIGNVTKPFTHFQITLMEPGMIFIKNLDVTLS